MSARLRTHIRSNIIGYVALFFALSTGSAFALSGSNTVFTDDITDNQVYSADVRNDTLTGGGLAAADLKPGSVGTSEVVNNSLTGADINEASLGQVPSASNADFLDGQDSSGFVRQAGGFLLFPSSGAAPAPADCDGPEEEGRAIVRTDGSTPTTLYICTAIGWVGK